MKFSAVAVLALPLAFASPMDLEKRADNAAKVIAAIKKAGTDNTAFKKTLDTIPNNGPISSSQQIKLQNQDQAILTDLQNANKLTTSSSAFTEAESKNGYTVISNLFAPTQATLTDVVNHKAAFAAASLTSLVCSDLSDLKSAIDTLSQSLQAKSTSDYAAKAPALQAKYDNAFSSATSSFGC